MEVNHETKMAKVREIEQAEEAMSKRIDKLVSHGDLEEEALRRGCGAGCVPWLRRSGRSRLAQESDLEVAVFGRSAAVSSAVNANARLEKAAEQMENHAEQLYAKAGASRSKAKTLMAQGKKVEAMVSLKRAKALEKQAEDAASTHAAIEQQKDMLESSALQREVANALSVSISSTKQKTKGLLEKAENAVDGSAELRDAVDDISEVMGGLNTNDRYDEGELLEELRLMAQEGEEEAPSARAVVEPQAIVSGIEPALYPKAPVACRRGEKREATRRLPHEDAESRDAATRVRSLAY